MGLVTERVGVCPNGLFCSCLYARHAERNIRPLAAGVSGSVPWYTVYLLEYSVYKQQGYVLAQIVTEINAPDLDVGGAGVVAEGNDGDAIFGSVHRHAEDADYVD